MPCPVLIDQLEIDIKLNGLLCPLVVNNGVLIDGHHRYEAIKDFCTETLVGTPLDLALDKVLYCSRAVLAQFRRFTTLWVGVLLGSKTTRRIREG